MRFGHGKFTEFNGLARWPGLALLHSPITAKGRGNVAREVAMRTILFYVFIVLPALLILAVGGVIALSLQAEPMVATSPRLDSRSADEAWRVLRRLVVTAAKATDDVVLNLSKAELDGLLALASRGIPFVNAQAEFSQDSLTVQATLTLPPNPFGRYLNLKAGVLDSRQGLILAPVSTGRLQIPGEAVESLARLGLDVALGSSSGGIVLDTIDRVNVDARQIAVHLKYDPRMVVRLKSWDERLAEVRDRVQPLGDPATVRVYFSRLIDKTRQTGNARAPLTDGMAAVFTLARERSVINDPVVENQAAILALAGFYGEAGVLRLVGPVITEELQSKMPRGRVALVAGREDLPKHFLISAALQIISTSGMSHAVGELKELLDTGKGGTGFSFVDLAADRAGVRWAEVALSRDSARRLQEKLAANPTEGVFFPPIGGLQEWMPQATFEQRYGNLDDNRYKAVVRDIDARIKALSAYAS